jgi:hypothetical protein
VAVKSIHGKGGGVITEADAINKDHFRATLVKSSEKDLIFHILKSVKASNNKWKIIP